MPHVDPLHSALSAALTAELARLRINGLARQRRISERPQQPHIVVDGRETIAFCSNDYLGLANDPRVIAAAREGAQRYGVGAGASHMILGHSSAHDALEHKLADFVRLPRALLFSTGYMANIAIVTALAGRGDAVFADKLNHASLNDAVVLSRAHFRRFRHRDLGNLERSLETSSARRKLVVSDAVFSMDGEIAPVPALLALCERYDAWLLLDDAHGFGVLGDEGRGVLQHHDVRSQRIIYMATLGKAAGVFGAFAAGESELIELLVQRARPYIYTTALPPLLAHALSTSLDIISHEPWRRLRLLELTRRFKRSSASSLGSLLPSETAIQALVVGANERALELAQALRNRGLEVPAIRPPTVAPGSARLRITFSAAHSDEDLDSLVAALSDIVKTDGRSRPAIPASPLLE